MAVYKYGYVSSMIALLFQCQNQKCKSLTVFIRKTSLNPQNLMPLKVFQHSPNYLQSYKVIRYKIATYLFSTLKNLRFVPTLEKIPNGNPAEMR